MIDETISGVFGNRIEVVSLEGARIGGAVVSVITDGHDKGRYIGVTLTDDGVRALIRLLEESID